MPYILRSIHLDDLNDIHQLSKLVNFINLPPDIEQLNVLINKSMKSFTNPLKKMEENYYMFVAQNLSDGKVVGCSLIHAQHGTTKEPHYYLSVGQEYKFSKSLNTGFVHGTLKLGVETNGHSEIGALLLHPDHRANGEKIGKQLSFVRFLYMAAFPERFKETIHVELMPPLDADGNSPLWEAIGRRFLNMDYLEADLISRKNKEFILSLYPSNNIYQTLLPTEARLAIGKVGTDTEPVKKMLEEIGFYYTQEVDPFDGGPHYRCPLKDILPVKEKFQGKLVPEKKMPAQSKSHLIQIPSIKNSSFCAIKTLAYKQGDSILIPQEIFEQFPIENNVNSLAIPFDLK